VASITINATAGGSSLVIATGQTLTISSNVSFVASIGIPQLQLLGTGSILVGGNIGAGGTITAAATSTVTMNGSVAQTMRGATYGNVTLQNSGAGVQVTGAPLVVNGSLSVAQGTLTDVFPISGTAAGSLSVGALGTLKITQTFPTGFGISSLPSTVIYDSAVRSASSFAQ